MSKFILSLFLWKGFYSYLVIEEIGVNEESFLSTTRVYVAKIIEPCN
jgi:hypothetical protein